MAIQDDIVDELSNQIKGSLDSLKVDLGKLRTGRANVAMLDGIRVNYYGTATPLNQCANMSIADARLIVVRPYEKSLLAEIEKAIRTANIGINPQNDGDIIRLPIPQLTEERRKDLVKQAKGRGEEAKIAVRNHRRDANEMLKQAEKEKEISEDEEKRSLEKVQQIVDKANADVEAMLASKEKDILAI